MPISHWKSLPEASPRIFRSGPTSKYSETAGPGPSEVRTACPKYGKIGSLFGYPFLIWNLSRTIPGGVLRRLEVKIFGNGPLRAVRVRPARCVIGTCARKIGKIGSLFGYPFLIWNPSRTIPGGVSRRLEVKIFGNGPIRAVRVRPARCVIGTCARKIGKIGSLFGYPFLVWNPSRTVPGGVS